MATCTSNVSQSRLMPRDGFSCASACLAPGQAGAEPDSPKSISGIVIYPTVKIPPSETAKRLGPSWRWWLSETIRVPIGSKIQFRFQGPTHLLTLYDEYVRSSGETSIDGLPSSRLGSFGHKLTFGAAEFAHREWREAGASLRVTFRTPLRCRYRATMTAASCREYTLRIKSYSTSEQLKWTSS